MSANNTPTAFTDEDLRKLQEEADAIVEDRARPWIEASKLKLLLVRLKWAEKCAELCATDENCCNIPELGENDTSPYYLWKKAAGKDASRAPDLFGPLNR